MEINLSEKEKFIISYLRSVKKSIPALRNVEMRIAGGWVRDKLMGTESDDIDIAISNMSGHDIVQILKRYDGSDLLGNPFVVSLEKSLKSEQEEDINSLQVGGIDIGGQKVEFVPMRTERYESGSRIPILEITNDPKLDSMRRDLTINSLYYNIDTGMVEDYTGGINDLKNMVLKTPDEAKKTFAEDPLRILRALRFYSRYPNSKIDPSIIQAIADPEIQQAYVTKVSPERAGTEIMKMMAGHKPDEATRILFETGMYKAVFGNEIIANLNPIDMDQQSPHHKHNLMNHTILAIKNINNISIEEGLSEKERSLMNLSAMFHDLGKLDPSVIAPHRTNPGQTTYHGHEYLSADIAEAVLKRLGIGQERDFVTTIVRHHMRPHKDMSTPKAIGRFIRKTQIMEGGEDRPLWKYIMLHSIADTLSKGGVDYDQDLEQKRSTMERIEGFIEEQEQKGMTATSHRPLLNGNEIISIIPELNPKYGFIKEVMGRLLEAQDEGSIFDKQTATQFVENIKGEILEKYTDKEKYTEATNWLKRLKIADKNYHDTISKNNSHIRVR